MATFTRTYISVETTAGEFLSERVTIADQVQYEKTARANGWTPQKDQAMTNMFMGWHALKRTGKIDCTFDEFKDICLDTQADTTDIDTDTGLEIMAEAGDPTR